MNSAERINPLRWIKGEPPPLEEVLKTMRERAAKFNCREDQATGSCRLCWSARRRDPGEQNTNDNLIGQKHAGPGAASDQIPVPEHTFAERARTLVSFKPLTKKGGRWRQ